MSKIILTANDGGTGTVNIQSPATDSNRVISLADADGTLSPLVLEAAQAASGTSVNFTGIPSWVKRITVSMDGISAAATGGVMLVRIGNGTVATTGYWGVNLGVSGATTSTGVNTTGFWVGTAGNAANSIMYGVLILTLHNASTNTWSGIFTGSRDDSSDVFHSSHGIVTLSGPPNVLSLVMSSSTFDAGTVSIMYE